MLRFICPSKETPPPGLPSPPKKAQAIVSDFKPCYVLPVSFSRECRENKPLYKAGPFDEAFNITDKLNIEKVSTLIYAGLLKSQLTLIFD